MLQYRYDTQLLIEGQGLDEDEITDWILENKICHDFQDFGLNFHNIKLQRVISM